MKTNQKPIHEIRLGTVKAAIWRDQAGESIRHNVTFSRLYKKGEEKWKSSDSFGRDDLPKLALVAQKAYEWILTPTAAE
jgi:hypothetical protein